ncbi:MAG: amino acid permease [Verrucomicrobia bacterium]|nr:MAG: amino acid permease [Verrucomicrobia bacterium 13_1_40CM_4_54_4]PYJ51151.1 MAG: amino acid permease [Verrucomicrobiota bacterium]PYJ79909.1 MAG: amino acid permease [Verrucomicrobiota bacterium]
MNLLRRKSVTQLQADALTDNRLKRALGATNLTALGIGAIIGTGIFVLTGTVAAQNAGPAVVLSFVFAGVASIFAALCYSEFASLVPMAGSAYTYGYATLGELFAWIIGWDLILEYALGAVTVSIGWSGYVVSFLRDIGIHIPPELSAARGTLITLADGTQVAAIFNLPAVIIIAVVTLLLVIGIRESATVNNVIVFVKVAVVLVFIIGAAHAVNPANWHPFIPPSTGARGHFGWSGVMQGAGIVFFAYIGFDAVSTAAQEAKNPQHDMPIGIIGSLLICTVLYIAVSALATGIVPYPQLDVPDPIAVAADHGGMGWMAGAIKLGAIAGLSSVILVMLLGQSRIFWTMADDGLLPKFVSRVHPKFRTPWITTIVTGVVVAFFAALFTVREAGSLVSIGTLLAFVIVSIGVLVLRIREPDLPRTFKTPAVWIVAPLGALSALYLMVSLPWRTWERLIIWFVIGMFVYFFYGVRRSKLAQPRV